MRFLYILATTTAALMLGSRSASACSLAPQTFEEHMAAADTVFVGTVTQADNKEATLHIDKAYKNAKDSETFKTEMVTSTCGIQFMQGQTWLYMGPHAGSGSLQLKSETGRLNAYNLAVVQEKLKPESPFVTATGEMTNTCAPWGGGSLTVTLTDGLSATIYTNISTLEQNNGSLTFKADHVMQGHARIMQCDNAGKNCVEKFGSVTVGKQPDGSVSGAIEWTEENAKLLEPFIATVIIRPKRCL